MQSSVIQTRSVVSVRAGDLNLWPDVSEIAIAEKAERYRRNREAVNAYFSGMTMDQIRKTFDIVRSELHRLRNRCLSIAPDGRIWGYRACVPGVHTKLYERSLRTHQKDGRGCAGLLQKLFRDYPAVMRGVLDLHFGDGAPDGRSRERFDDVHNGFLKLCRRAGIRDSEYPFSTQHLAGRSLADWLEKQEKQNPEAAARALGDASAWRKMKKSGSGHPKQYALTRPYGRVQLDGHRIDAESTVLLPLPNGGHFPVSISRMWLLILIDVLSTAVLGYHITFGQQYTAEDVYECIKSALFPWVRPQLTMSTLTFSEECGMPNEIFPELQFASFDEILLDNALQHAQGELRDTLTTRLGAAVNFGAVATPESRAIAERFFKTYEEASIHRMPNTTGSNSLDRRRGKADKIAIKYAITGEHIEEISAVTITNYNGLQKGTLGHRSPLGVLHYHIRQQGVEIAQIPEKSRGKLDYLQLRLMRTVQGSVREGKRPFIYFMCEVYTNDALASGYDLIGQEITLIVDRREIQSLRAYLPNGGDLGVLSAQGIWRNRPHSLFLRQEYNRLKRGRKITLIGQSDPVEAVRSHFRTAATINRRAATIFAKLQREAKRQAEATPKSEETPQSQVSEVADAADKVDFAAAPVARRGPRRVILF